MPIPTVPSPVPADRLTDEHLSTIFLLALEEELSIPEHELSWQYGHGQLTRVPLVVSQVSKKWRNCALQTAALWRVLQCGYIRQVDQGLWTKHDMTRLWLERAATTKLDLRIVVGRVQPKPAWGQKNKEKISKEPGPHEAKEVDFIDEVLREHLCRCERLRITLATRESTSARVLKAIAETPSTAVATVELCRPESLEIKKISYSSEMLNNLWPNLQHLTLIRLPPSTSPQLIRGLRSFRVQDCPASSLDVDKLVECFRHCPDLMSLRLDDVEHDVYRGNGEDNDILDHIPTTERNLERGPFAIPQDQICLPKLSSLRLRLVPMFWVRRLAERVATPALRDLCMAQFMMDDTFNMMSEHGIPSATLGIRRLDLGSVETLTWPIEEWGADMTNRVDTKWLLSKLSSLRTLVLDTKLSIIFLRVLAEDAESENPCLCPKLETLAGGFHVESLIRFLEARKKNEKSSSIRELRLPRELDPEDVKRLSGMVPTVTALWGYTLYEELPEDDGREGEVEREAEGKSEGEEDEEGAGEDDGMF